jgi:hypothetical protein
MTEPTLDAKAILRRFQEARDHGDAPGMAVALTMLSQALFEADKVEEREFSMMAWQIAKTADDYYAVLLAQSAALLARGAELEEAAGPAPLIWLADGDYPSFHTRHRLLRGAVRAYRCAGSTLLELRGDGKAVREDAYARANAVQKLIDQDRPAEGENLHLFGYAELVAGFFALKVAGPFLEAFAKKLGDQFAESTARALGRIRLRKHQLEVEVPDAKEPLILVLPDDLTDDARLALIDLQVPLEGGTLRWNPDTRAWEQKPSAEPTATNEL